MSANDPGSSDVHIHMDDPLPNQIRTPVWREGAEKYLLLTLLSFAASVSLTRLFLDLTGYPQIGNSELHIAHVLWGGLLLYVAALFPLIFVNRWAYSVSAVLGGVGIGLFIDEVGKFITQSNDYFYPPAAPIIYAFFLLTVLLYNRARRKQRDVQLDVRTQMYAIMDGLDEVLDHDLSEIEREHLLKRLNTISAQTRQPDILRLIDALREFICCEQLYVVPHRLSPTERVIHYLRHHEQRWMTRRGLRIFLSGGLLAMSFWALYNPILLAMSTATPGAIDPLVESLVASRLIGPGGSLLWYQAHLVLQGVVGIMLLIGAALLAIGRDRRGVWFSYVSLLLALTTINLLMFYFNQFSSIIVALIQLILFLGVLYYRAKYLENGPVVAEPVLDPAQSKR